VVAPDAVAESDVSSTPPVFVAGGSTGVLAVCFAPEAGAVTVLFCASASSADWRELTLAVEAAGFAAGFATAVCSPACGAGADAGGEWLPACGKLPPGCPPSVVLEAATLRAGLGLASFSAPANVDSLPVVLAGFDAAALADTDGLTSK
jgi:hypothetical protein